MVGGPQLLDARYEFDHSDPAEAAFPGEIRSGIERDLVRGHDDGQGPAARAREHLADCHVDLVDIRPLFAIDLDVDEGFVHQGCDDGVFEGLVLHHMAPVTGGVSDGEEDRLCSPRGPS